MFSNIKAQSDDFKMAVGVNAGATLAGPIIKLAEDATDGEVDAKVTPAIQGTFDYGLAKVFSIGLAYSFQNAKLEYNDPIEGEYSVAWKRMSLAVRPLLHYANNDKLDLYSGFRLGLKLNSVTVTGYDEYDTSILDPIYPVAFQLILWGGRYYITENIGINLELAIGSPYFAAGGISFRL